MILRSGRFQSADSDTQHSTQNLQEKQKDSQIKRCLHVDVRHTDVTAIGRSTADAVLYPKAMAAQAKGCSSTNWEQARELKVSPYKTFSCLMLSRAS